MAASSIPSPIIYLNGDLLDANSARISPFDHGLLTGDGVFETLKSYEGKPFASNRHYLRMGNAASVFGLHLPPEDELNSAMISVLEVNQLKSARIRVTVTGGASPLSSERGNSDETVVIAASPIPEYPPSAKLITVDFTRNENGALSGLKSTSYGENVIAQKIAREKGADEAIFGNSQGNLCEGSMTNMFVVVSGRLMTPPLSSGCLPGVTRAIVLDLAKRAGIECAEADFPLASLELVEEAFLTSTLREIQPVEKVNGTAIPVLSDGFCAALKREFAEMLDSGKWL